MSASSTSSSSNVSGKVWGVVVVQEKSEQTTSKYLFLKHNAPNVVDSPFSIPCYDITAVVNVTEFLETAFVKHVGLRVSVTGLLKVEYTAQQLEPPHDSTINIVAIYRAVLCSTNVGEADEGAVNKKWLTLKDIQRLANDTPDMLLQPQFVLRCVSIVEENGGVAQKGRGVVLQYIEEELSWEDKILQQAEYGTAELTKLSDQFKKLCGEDCVMNKQKFCALLVQLSCSADMANKYYRVLTHINEGDSQEGLTLQQFQLAIAALDPTSSHAGLCAQYRCQLIFNYYTDMSDVMTYNQFRSVYSDISKLKGLSFATAEGLEEAAKQQWKLTEAKKELSLKQFTTAVGQLKFRGTSLLLRAPISPVGRQHQLSLQQQQQQQKQQQQSVDEQQQQSPKDEGALPEVVPAKKYKADDDDEDQSEDMEYEAVGSEQEMALERSKETAQLELEAYGYSIATHFVQVRSSGLLSDVKSLWQLADTDAVSKSVKTLLQHSKPGFQRFSSIHAFDKNSVSNEMLSGLRYFERSLTNNGRGKPKKAFNWGPVDMATVASCIMTLCQQIKMVLMKESRLLHVPSPAYVLGDLHGNFHDLMCFEKMLWRMGPLLTPSSFVFLGDYVDRGPHGVEVIAYLFAQKLLCPSKFLLLRGNHEIRMVQEQFTFKRECEEKFGMDWGQEVWEAINICFDCMPLAAVVDNKILCLHGGIPYHGYGNGLLKDIEGIPIELSDPEMDSLLAWDLMWNDPLRDEDVTDDITEELQKDQGFVDNEMRQTAHLFSSQALEKYLSTNELSHVIRAHEVKQSGFQLQQSGRLLTVFSSSHYCGGSNEAACVLIDCQKIRTIRIDTS